MHHLIATLQRFVSNFIFVKQSHVSLLMILALNISLIQFRTAALTSRERKMLSQIATGAESESSSQIENLILISLPFFRTAKEC